MVRLAAGGQVRDARAGSGRASLLSRSEVAGEEVRQRVEVTGEAVRLGTARVG